MPLDDPALVVGPLERAQRQTQLLDGVEATDPQQVLFQHANQSFGALLVIRGGERVMSPGRRRARRGGLCLDTEHCARTGRRRGRAAASPARGRGAAAATSAVATTPLPWC